MSTEPFDLDALEVEEENGAPFTFTYKGDTYSMPTAQAMPWQDQMALETATAAESMRLILGDDQYERLSKQPMSTARMAKLIEAWSKHQGLKPGE